MVAPTIWRMPSGTCSRRLAASGAGISLVAAAVTPVSAGDRHRSRPASVMARREGGRHSPPACRPSILRLPVVRSVAALTAAGGPAMDLGLNPQGRLLWSFPTRAPAPEHVQQQELKFMA